ncbi:2OG-Fe(II) oxygenase [Actinophytocola sp.]|uniref:2OG-Fe(II) oxygenase n=1 Tax=Actinophytocola sp. TaxID=1872138 RepID=UPI0025BC7E05|nr:2OG-Fe(II) oxygenase [Actinophytocola sp.]
MYGKGQFFLPDQDSEKHDAMVGTLVVSLPSAHTGGELVIDHAGESRTYRASKEELTLVAFYADCRHGVTPVRSGYRVALTFNLLAEAETPAPEAGPATELAHCLTEHFTTSTTSRYGRSGPRPAEPAGLPARPRVHPAGPDLAPAQGRRRGACRAGARRGRAGRVRDGAGARRSEGDLGRPAVRQRPVARLRLRRL